MTRQAGHLRWLSALVVACAACPASASAAPTVTEFTGGVTPGFSANRDPEGITVGSDGNIWFTEESGTSLGRVNPNGTVSEFPLTSERRPRGIAGAPDGTIWYTTPNTSVGNAGVGRRNPNGTFTDFTPGMTPGFTASDPEGITVGPDGNAWFTEGNGIARMNPNGTVTEFRSGVTPGFSANAGTWGINTGPDGNIWFTEPGLGIARLNPNGTVTEFKVGVTPGLTYGFFETLTAGPDGNVWFARNGGDHPGVGRINSDGTATEFTRGVTPGFSSDTYPEGTTVGCDHDIWFSELGSSGGVGRLNPDNTVTEYLGGVTPGLSSNAGARRVTSGPDGNIWFAEPAGRIVRLTPPPGAETQTASGIGLRSARLGGTVRPCHQPTFYSFEYGTSTSYGNATTPAGAPGVLFAIDASTPVNGLRPGTLYHYRLDATNHSGTTYGVDRTFKTPPFPIVGVLGAHPAVFAAESSGASATTSRKHKKVHRGTTVRFTLNEAATVRFTVTKRVPGRKIKRGKKKVCVKPRHKNRSHKRCKRVVTLKGSFTIKGVAGKNRFHFTGRLRGKKLPPGRYRLVATPIIGGVAAKSSSTAFRIVR